MKDGRASFVDVRDIAAVTIGVLVDGGREGKTYQVTGPESLSFADVAKKLSDATGRRVRYVDLPAEEFVKTMRGAGVPEWLATELAALHELFSKGLGDFVTDVVQSVGGKHPITLDQFAREFAMVFKGAPHVSVFAAYL